MPESQREKIAAVVVTYNRKHLLGECLNSLLLQTQPLDGLYVIDNHSTDGTYEHLRDTGLLSHPGGKLEISYIRMPQNEGGAGGFAEGIERAVNAGYDWLWLMDDDVVAAPDALAVLVAKKDAIGSVGGRPILLNSLVLDRDRADGDTLAFPLQELRADGEPRIGVYHWRLSEVRHRVEHGLYRWICPFNGTFVPARLIAEIGLPNREFFIWGDERDFLWRAIRRADVYTAVDSKVYHPPSRQSVFDWKQYYHVRNAIVLNRYFRHRHLRNLKLVAASLVRGLRHGPSGLRLVLRAMRDGFAGRLGRRDDLHP